MARNNPESNEIVLQVSGNKPTSSTTEEVKLLSKGNHMIPGST